MAWTSPFRASSSRTPSATSTRKGSSSAGPSAATSARPIPRRAYSAGYPVSRPRKANPFWYSRFGYSMRLGLISLLAVIVGIRSRDRSVQTKLTGRLCQSFHCDHRHIGAKNFVMMIFMLIILGTWPTVIDILPRNWAQTKPWMVPALVLGFGTMAFTARMTTPLDVGSDTAGLYPHGTRQGPQGAGDHRPPLLSTR